MNGNNNSVAEPLTTIEKLKAAPMNYHRTVPNPFDPASLRLDEAYVNQTATQKLLLTVPVRKPSKQEFIQVHPSEDCRLSPVGIIEVREDNETYIVTPQVANELSNEHTFCSLFLAINRHNVIFIWPVKLPNAEGKSNAWNDSALQAAQVGMGKWIRIESDRSLGAYVTRMAVGTLPEPVWSKESFSEICQIAFRGKIIDTLDHPVLQKLSGAI
jgi:hypothetical protein